MDWENFFLWAFEEAMDFTMRLAICWFLTLIVLGVWSLVSH